MGVKKGKWAAVKEILFTYLALSKIMYWMETVTVMNPVNLADAAQGVMMRFLGRDLMLIIGVTAFFFLDKVIALKKSKYSSILEHVIFYAVGYVVLMSITFVYMLGLNLVFLAQEFSLGVFAREFTGFLPSSVPIYIVVVIALNVKLYFKAKGKQTLAQAALPNQSTEDKLTMLKALLDDGVLTQEEFDSKKEKLQRM